MGKDLKNRELGVGISQRKDGFYMARFTDKYGKRRQKYFSKLQECRQWLADMQFNDQHGDINALGNMTVNAWFDYWITEIKSNNLRDGTVCLYKSQYNNHIKDYIGEMLLNEVKPLHCQNILNKLSKTHRTSFIENIRILLFSIMSDAVENDLILQNPVRKSVKCIGKKEKEKRVLTREEQSVFLNAISNEKELSPYENKQVNSLHHTRYNNQYAFILQTGLRAGEMIGLEWDDINFQKKYIFVQRTMRYSNSSHSWIRDDPKTAAGKRKIPLTQEAISILKKQKEMNKSLKIIPLEFKNNVFLSKKGEPIGNDAYDSDLLQICKETGMKHFSMHTLRHTFATRCIEAGMKPKTLQTILGHSKLEITMDLYVHVTEDERIKELEAVEKMLKIM